jgi:hypothetical protein
MRRRFTFIIESVKRENASKHLKSNNLNAGTCTKRVYINPG